MENRQQKIVNMFDDIASTYDLANRVLSMGIDREWRKKGCNRAYEILNSKNITQITDVACGTGDLLIFWERYAKRHGVSVEKYIGIDPSVKMLEVAKKKVNFAEFIEGKAQDLPIEDNSTEIISISYGIRNVVDRVVDFGMKRVLPIIGGIISKNYEAYKYLPNSIEEFLTTDMLAEELESVGFKMKYIKSFSMGISTLLIAQKIKG